MLRFAHPLLAQGSIPPCCGARPGDAPEPREHRVGARTAGQAPGAGRRSRERDLKSLMKRPRWPAFVRACARRATRLCDQARREQRSARSARRDNHFNAGDPGRAREMLANTIETLPPEPAGGGVSVLAGVQLFDDSFTDALDLAKRPWRRPRLNRRTRAGTGDAGACQLTSATSSRLRSARRKRSPFRPAQSAEAALSSALAAGDAQFFGGGGLDEPGLRRALQLEDRCRHTGGLRPSMYHANTGMDRALDEAARRSGRRNAARTR